MKSPVVSIRFWYFVWLSRSASSARLRSVMFRTITMVRRSNTGSRRASKCAVPPGPGRAYSRLAGAPLRLHREIDRLARDDGVRPIVFSTLIEPQVREIVAGSGKGKRDLAGHVGLNSKRSVVASIKAGATVVS